MSSNAILALVAALSAIAVAILAAWRQKKGLAKRLFVVGMLILAADSALSGMAALALGDKQRPFYWFDFAAWEERRFWGLSLAPGIWLCFSLAFARGNHREFFKRWKVPLTLAYIVPLALVLLTGNAL